MNNRNLIFIDSSAILNEIGESVTEKMQQYCEDNNICVFNKNKKVPKRWGGYLFPLKLRKYTKEEVAAFHKEIAKFCTDERLREVADRCYKDTRRLRRKGKEVNVCVGLVKACRDVKHAGILIVWER